MLASSSEVWLFFRYDTGSIGSITEMPTFQTSIAVLSPTMRGLTVSFLLLMGAIPSLMAGLLADKYGHVRIVLAGAVAFTIGAALEAAATNLPMLLVGRSLVGIGEGLYLGNLNVYICEIAPRARRGQLVAMPQALVTLGTCLGYFTCYGTIQIPGEMAWRLPFIIQAVGGALLALACLFLPESPRWLMARNRAQEAMHHMELLEFGQDEIQQDLRDIIDQLPSGSDTAAMAQPQFDWRAVMDIFRRKYRFRTTLALFILGMVQLCGIDGVLYVSLTPTYESVGSLDP
jgi:MFS family permease